MAPRRPGIVEYPRGRGNEEAQVVGVARKPAQVRRKGTDRRQVPSLSRRSMNDRRVMPLSRVRAALATKSGSSRQSVSVGAAAAAQVLAIEGTRPATLRAAA